MQSLINVDISAVIRKLVDKLHVIHGESLKLNKSLPNIIYLSSDPLN